MASAIGLSGSRSDSRTTDKSITAQDSEITQDSTVLNGNGNLYDLDLGTNSFRNAFANANVNLTHNITDGGAFKLVENLGSRAIDGAGDMIKSIAGMLGSWVKEQNSFAISSTTSLLNSARVANQESALTAQENTMNFLKCVVVGGALVAVVYIVVKNKK